MSVCECSSQPNIVICTEASHSTARARARVTNGALTLRHRRDSELKGKQFEMNRLRHIRSSGRDGRVGNAHIETDKNEMIIRAVVVVLQ